jgi:hypothetical protein
MRSASAKSFALRAARRAAIKRSISALSSPSATAAVNQFSASCSRIPSRPPSARNTAPSAAAAARSPARSVLISRASSNRTESAIGVLKSSSIAASKRALYGSSTGGAASGRPRSAV